MSLLDALLLLILALFALRGWARGFFREGFALAGLVGGVLVAMRVGHELAPAFAPWLAGEIALVAAWAAIVAATMLAAALLGRLLERLARAVFLGPPSRVAGAVLGSAKGAALLGIGLLVAERASPSAADAIRHSRLGRPLAQFARLVLESGRSVLSEPARRAA